MNGLEIFILIFLYVCVALLTGCLLYVLGEDETLDKKSNEDFLIIYSILSGILWPITFIAMLITMLIYNLSKVTCKIIRNILKK